MPCPGHSNVIHGVAGERGNMQGYCSGTVLTHGHTGATVSSGSGLVFLSIYKLLQLHSEVAWLRLQCDSDRQKLYNNL
ncbi:hypothetical protein BGY98DRAFT_961517 [Russula aff. rugulosa BPL654]|nr:hypothetical protein BGY98DRAFT_961517 [Russula aff. rugulosa BPL654]